MSGQREATPATATQRLERVRARAARDRDFYDKGRTAFVSFVLPETIEGVDPPGHTPVR